VLWNGSECGKTKVMRISRQPFPAKNYGRSKTTGECGIS
jgi:hypothetical protein